MYKSKKRMPRSKKHASPSFIHLLIRPVQTSIQSYVLPNTHIICRDVASAASVDATWCCGGTGSECVALAAWQSRRKTAESPYILPLYVYDADRLLHIKSNFQFASICLSFSTIAEKLPTIPDRTYLRRCSTQGKCRSRLELLWERLRWRRPR